MQRIVYALITILALSTVLPGYVVTGGVSNGSQSAIVTVLVRPAIAPPPIPPPPVYEEDGEPPILAPPAPAVFSVSNLSVQPAEVKPKEAVTITVSVDNTGGTEGTYTVVLKINEVKEAEKRVTIAAGGSQDVSFTVSKADAGSYSVVVDGLSDSFSVVAPEAPPEEVLPPEEVAPPEVLPPEEIAPPVPAVEAGGYGWLIAIISAVVAIAAFIAARKRLQLRVYGWLPSISAGAALAFTTARECLQRAAVVGAGVYRWLVYRWLRPK